MTKTTDLIEFYIRPEGFNLLRQTVKQLNLRHRPFIKRWRGYHVELYPADSLTFFVLKMHDYIVK